MMSTKFLFIANSAILAALLLVSCQNSQYVASKSTSKKPKFIESISLGGHDKYALMTNGIDNKYSYYNKQNSNSDANSEDMISIGGDEGISYNINNNPRIDPSISNTLTEKYANLLGVLTKQIANLTLYNFIEEWYGVRYRLGGNSKQGIDCSSFAQRLYMEVFGIDLFRTACEQFNNCIRVRNTNEATEGDLVFFHVHGRRISHVGIYLTNDFFVHSSTTQGVVISNLNDEYWHRRYAGIGRIPRG